jgi:hypothetical protein
MSRHRPRHRYVPVPDNYTLDRRLIPSALIAPAITIGADPLPDPEPSPGTDPGSSGPLTPPPLPPSGPIGPGTC